MTSNTIAQIVSDRRILVLTGTGGVGKTTVAAVLALEAAQQGRRVALVTIDPAKRLADALGIENLGNQPSEISFGEGDGSLVAMMLDTKSTFDELVTRYAQTPEQAQRILANNFYTNISNALSGTQEYMAMEKLYELTMSGNYDLVVVDTPPSRNALAFLDSPNLLARLIDHWLYRALMTPTRTLLKASQLLLRQLSKIVGSDVVEDVVAFFQAFEGMEAGFKERSQTVMQLLGADSCSFVLVASARRDTTIEAVYFADQLARNGISIDAVIINRLQPAIIRLTRRPRAPEFEPFLRAHDELHALSDREATHIDSLLSQIQGDPVQVRIPLLETDVHDLEGLERLRALIFG